MFDVFGLLPASPLSLELSLITAAMLVSLTAALIALILNHAALRASGMDEGEEGDLGAVFENPASILPHLIELRGRVIRSLIAIGIGAAAAGILAEPLLQVMAAPIGGTDNLTIIRVTESVSVFFRVTLTAGLVLASPFVIAQIWIFVAAGLKPSERNLFYLLFPFAALLFISGVAFAYFVMLPVAVPFLVQFLGLEARPTLEDYVSFVTTILLFVGLSFELPLIMFGLAKARIVNTRMLIKNWRIAFVLIAVLSAIITPTPDPINMGIVAAPLLLLYGLSIILTLFAR